MKGGSGYGLALGLTLLLGPVVGCSSPASSERSAADGASVDTSSAADGATERPPLLDLDAPDAADASGDVADATAAEDGPATPPPPQGPVPIGFQPCAARGGGTLVHSILSPDGRDLAVATWSGQLLILDPVTGERQRTIWDLPGRLSTVAFSRRGDVLMAANADELRAWAYPEGRLLLTLSMPHPTKVDRVDLSPDETLLATGAYADTKGIIVGLWSFPDGKKLASLRIANAFGYAASPVLFSPDGKQLLVGARSFEVAALLQAGDTLFGLGTEVGAQGAYTADYAYLAQAGSVVERATGKEVKAYTHSTTSRAEAFSPDDQHYVETQAERVFLHKFDRGTFTPVTELSEEQWVGHVQFTPDSQLLILDLGVDLQYLSGHGDRIRFRRMPMLTIERTLSIGPFGVGVTRFSADGNRIARAEGSDIWVGDAAGGRTVATLKGALSSGSGLLGLSSDGALVVTTGQILEVPSGALRTGFARIELLSPSGRLLSWHDDLSKQHVFVLLSDLSRELGRLSDASDVLAFSADDRAVLTAPAGDPYSQPRTRATLIDVRSGAVVQTLSGWTGDLGTGRFSRDGGYLIKSSSGQTEVLRVKDGTKVGSFPVDVDVSPDGRHLVTGSGRNEGGVIKVLRLDDLSTELTLRGHGSNAEANPFYVDYSVQAVSWSAGNVIASAAADGTVRLWCVPR
jgi:WD40 repeat protein